MPLGVAGAPLAGQQAAAGQAPPAGYQPAPPPTGAYAAAPPQATGSYPLAQHHRQQLSMFWNQQMQEVENVSSDPNDFKNHQLPLARIKKIMKSDEDVRMISAEAPVLFARACEMFILELTLRSWIHSEENKRRTLQRNDIAAAVTKTDIFDFLVDIVPRDDAKDGEGGDGAGGGPAGVPGMAPGVPPGVPSSLPGAVDPAQYQAQYANYLQTMQAGAIPHTAPPLKYGDETAGALPGLGVVHGQEGLLYPSQGGTRPPGMMMPPIPGAYPGMPPMLGTDPNNIHGQPPPPM